MCIYRFNHVRHNRGLRHICLPSRNDRSWSVVAPHSAHCHIIALRSVVDPSKASQKYHTIQWNLTHKQLSVWRKCAYRYYYCFKAQATQLLRLHRYLTVPTQGHHYTESLTCSILYTCHLIDFFIWVIFYLLEMSCANYVTPTHYTTWRYNWLLSWLPS